MRVVAIVQARLGSTRLPGKVLLPIAGEPMLARVVKRLKHATSLDEVVVATSDLPGDDKLVDFCQLRGFPCFRGDESDVLDRYFRAAQHFEAEIIVRVTSDCPLIEASIVDSVVETLRENQADYASNTIEPRTFPRGLDVEAFTFAALQNVWENDRSAASREHVTPFFGRNPEKFSLRAVRHDHDLSRHRWTVDTPEDLEFVRRVYERLGPNPFDWRQVLELLARCPELSLINAGIKQKTVPL